MADLFHCKIITTELHFRNHIKKYLKLHDMAAAAAFFVCFA
jgi:hypothetical protein